MKFDTKQPEVVNKLAVINAAGFGKNTNQAINILIANGHFKNKASLDEDFMVYRELTKRFYKEDLKCLEELKNEL